MVEFTQAELELILKLSSVRGKDAKPFSFKGLSKHLEKNGCTEAELRIYAREIGGRIKESVEDKRDHRLNFRFTHIYPDGKIMTAIGGSISYTLL
jgi:hypothetical protein